jgi:hypothetical protein
MHYKCGLPARPRPTPPHPTLAENIAPPRHYAPAAFEHPRRPERTEAAFSVGSRQSARPGLAAAYPPQRSRSLARCSPLYPLPELVVSKRCPLASHGTQARHNNRPQPPQHSDCGWQASPSQRRRIHASSWCRTWTTPTIMLVMWLLIEPSVDSCFFVANHMSISSSSPISCRSIEQCLKFRTSSPRGPFTVTMRDLMLTETVGPPNHHGQQHTRGESEEGGVGDGGGAVRRP